MFIQQVQDLLATFLAGYIYIYIYSKLKRLKGCGADWPVGFDKYNIGGCISRGQSHEST